MEADRARRAHAIFTAALDTPAAARDAMLKEACAGDAAMEAKVRRLVAAAEKRADFLEVPAINTPADDPMPDAIGSYLVVGVLGSGGMATVYEAVQENPNRRVALKVLRHGVTHADAYLRFRLETEALALLHHPGIAQIYEAGTAPLGHRTPSPFFAMELVPGALTITEYAERHALSLTERLGMFAHVCDAVLHGHQNGIIHRDLKPGNILVGSDGRPKVIDFGIARMTESAPGGASSLTGETDTRKIIGTLNYMSPEQCERPGGIDVCSDVYSLGVVLYQLVARRLPHDLSRCSIAEAVRIIVSDTPRPASAACPQARGDLDAIIAKAMAKDRQDRYAGAGALGDDIRRYLAMHPVEARPISAVGQLVKFARRNRALTLASLAAVLALLAGVVVASRLAVAAGRSRDEALAKARELETVTGFQESLLRDIDPQAMGEQIRRGLLEALRKAKPSVDAGRQADAAALINSANFTTVAIGALRDSVLALYSESIATRFADQPLLRARMLMQLSDTMRALGLHAEAEPAVREAISYRLAELGEDHEDTLASRHALGSLLSTMGRYDEALPLLEDTHARLARTLGPDAALTMRTRSTLAGVLRRSGDIAGATRVWTDVLASQRRVLGDDDPDTLRTLNNLGIALAQQGRNAEAEASWRELLERRKRLYGEGSAEYGKALGNLGVMLQDQGRLSEARTLIEHALDVDRRSKGDRHADTLVTMAQLAELNADAGDFAEAEVLQRECVRGRLLSLTPAHRDTLRAQSFLAYILRERGAFEEADLLAASTLAAQRSTLGDGHPDTLATMSVAARVAMDIGRDSEAVRLSTEAVERARASARLEPGFLGRILWRHGTVLLAAGNRSGAETAMLEAFRLLEESVGAAHPHTRQAAGSLASFYRTAHERDPGAGHAARADEWAIRADPARPPRETPPK